MKEYDPENIVEEWFKVRDVFEKITGKKPTDLNSVLFIIGIQEWGKGIREFSKEEKQDLIHIGTCTVLALSGYYEFEKFDDDGWPHFKLKAMIPKLAPKEQVLLLKNHIIQYFYEQEMIDS